MIDTIESLQRIYGVILALAITEAFKEFAKPTNRDTKEKASDRWPFYPDNIWAIVSLLFLVIPFFQGMNVYLQRTYGASSSETHPAWLLFDIAIFTVEAVFIFLLSRSLPRDRWKIFYRLIGTLLLIDAVWGFIVYRAHGAPTTAWVMVNVICGPVLLLLAWRCENKGPIVCFVLVIFRTIVDYYTSWDLYFPP